jgi:anaerobic dimethyl sulfoxide reductase subunit B (iron-sulfur subunit)
MSQLAFQFDAAACIGCKTCQVVCKNQNDLPLGILYRHVIAFEAGTWEGGGDSYTPNNLIAYYISMACNHCAVPACIAVCPVSAIIKNEENGIVSIDQDLCIGCKACSSSCPYGAPRFREDIGVMTKCDFCESLISQGKSPACVATCPMRILNFGELGELQGKYGLGDNTVAPLPEDITGPSLVLIPYPNSPKGDMGDGRVVNFPEEL